MALEKYVDDDLIITALLFAGVDHGFIEDQMRKTGGNARMVLDRLKSPTASGQDRKRFGLIEGYLNNLGTGHLEKLMSEGAGLNQKDVESAIYWAQKETGGVATPTLDRVLYHLGGATGRTQTQGAVSFAATVRPGLQRLGRNDSGLMTTRTQYRTGTRPAPAPPPPPPGAPRPAGDFREQRSGAPAPAPRPAPAPPGGTQPLQTPGQRGTGGRLGGGTLGGGTTTTGAASAGIRNLPTLAADAPPEEVIKYIRKYYGYAAWTLDIPELRARMLEVARDFAGVPVDEATIMGRFTDLDWWKTHSDQQRLAIEEKAADPATYNAKVEGKFREVSSITGQLGFTVPEGRLRTIARDAYDQGWNTAEMRAALSAEFDFNPETGEEDQSRIVADLRQMASDYLVPLGEQVIDQWGKQIVAGTSTNEDFTAYAKSMAKGLFAHYAGDIDAGRTVKQIADPFRQMAMRDLELTEDQIDLMDPRWRKALELDPETGQPMQLSKWQRMIRSDSSYGWDRTQNARAEASEFASKIAESFGRR